jgi:steroid 5-alpha reductase family enzyme
MWIGIYLLAFPVLHGWQHIAILSPIFTIWLLMRVSGIPILEKMASKRWGDNPAYVAYQQNTALLIPFVY